MTELLNLKVVRKDKTIFMALPDGLRRPIAGGCRCAYCKAHPDKIPTWDTLAVSAEPHRDDRTWTVHFPDL